MRVPSLTAGEPRPLSYATTDSLDRYRRFFEDSRDGIYITDRNGAFLEVNASLSELTGWSREELLGRDALSLYEDAAQRAEFERELLQRGSVQNHEVKIRTRDNR